MHRLIGSSAAITTLRDEVICAARADAKVLITGESGVGKEVAARLIHDHSARRNGPFVAINCAGVPETLLEAELFGHVRGSFTDAYRDRPGVLESANRGTIFLDEIGEMSLRMQGLLLRFLETGEIQRIGATRTGATVDARVIAATNRDLMAGIQAKTFRDDLFYRLNVIRITIRPLRERKEDVRPLLSAFLTFYAERYGVDIPRVSPEAEALLLAYAWPGNVRELRNVAERLAVRTPGGPIPPADLPPEIAKPPAPAPAPETRPRATTDALFERMVHGRETFWSVVYDPFMLRDLTRQELRQVVQMGLERTRGSYPLLLYLFNMELDDHTRFVHFLRKHQCETPAPRFYPSAVEGTRVNGKRGTA
jgi:two-component system, NtrC family, response regulator HydG